MKTMIFISKIYLILTIISIASLGSVNVSPDRSSVFRSGWRFFILGWKHKVSNHRLHAKWSKQSWSSWITGHQAFKWWFDIHQLQGKSLWADQPWNRRDLKWKSSAVNNFLIFWGHNHFLLQIYCWWKICEHHSAIAIWSIVWFLWGHGWKEFQYVH